MKIKLHLRFLGLFILLSSFIVAVNTTLLDFFLPGTQPATISFTAPSNCSNCHGDYDIAVEPTYTWQGSMMSQSMRDPLFLAALAIANQDATAAGDLCLRCHTPAGWLSGRSVPTDGSNLTAQDLEGVDCHFCHTLINPQSQNAADLVFINALPNKPPQSGNGMYVIDNTNQVRRGPFNDPNANHTIIYDPFYSTSEYCATCHDVSNPAFSKSGSNYVLNDLNTIAPSFTTYHMFPAERTYSEWKMSSYNSELGIASSVFGGNKTHVSTCQDCHMKDVTGKGCNKQNAPTRTNLPQHDFTGGNTFVPKLIRSGVNTAALDAGILRARYMLQNAATMDLTVTQEVLNYRASVKITNETGHKLPSGYPEGRRMWLNVTAYDVNGNIIYESGTYNQTTAVLNTKDTYNNDAKIYETKLGQSSTGQETFNFALNNVILKDNRIPPRGFTNANFESIQAAPVGYTYADGDFFDTTIYQVPLNTYRINVKLLYQTVSKEYIDFLKNANSTNNAGNTLYTLWEANGKSTPEIMVQKDFYTNTLAIDVYSEVFNKPLNIYPNPVNGIAKLTYSLKNPDSIQIEVYDFTGKKVTTLYKGFVNTNESILDWNTQSLRSGTYIVIFKSSKRTFSTLVRVK